MRAKEGGKPDKRRYKTTNWREYNKALKARGCSLTVWLDKGMQWFAQPTGKRGRQATFSDAAIQFCLSIKCLLGLALRQAMGFVQSLIKFLGTEYRRQWRKVHLGIDAQTLEIQAIEVTDNSVGDAPMPPHLLRQTKPLPLANACASG